MKEGKMELIKDGKRLSGRGFEELRPIKIEVGVLKRADGSCYFELGNNKVIAGVYGPREMHPRHFQNAKMAVVKYRYNMAPFSVDDRKRPGPDRRSQEISMVSRKALDPVILRELYPKTAIEVYVEVLQSDAGTRTAGINAASVALADAGIPMRDLVSSVAIGKIDGPIAMIARTNTITLLQMDGRLKKEEFERGLKLAMDGSRKIYELQKAALVEKYSKSGNEE
jgi:exosome complex component RRP41